MGRLNEYMIPFSGLSVGQHHFQFLIEDKFFETYGNTLAQSGSVDVNLTLDKQSSMLVLLFSYKGYINADCDRCLQPVQIPVEGENRLVVKFGDTNADDTEEVITLPKEAHQLDVAPYMYEFVSLAVPYRKVPADCDAQDKYCDTTIAERMAQQAPPVDATKENVDPRWDKLKNLLDNNN